MNTFQRYLVEEFAEDFEEGHLSRREALKLIAGVTGSLLMANSILAACTPPVETINGGDGEGTSLAMGTRDTATAPSETLVSPSITGEAKGEASPTSQTTPEGTVRPEEETIESGDVQFPGDETTLLGYLSHPRGDEPRPVVLVCHENRGLTPHIKDVVRRLGRAGYAALAVDLLSRQGGSETLGADNVPGALGNSPPDQFVRDFLRGWDFMKGQAFAQAERVGMVGFCFGGGVTWLVATRMPELKAAAPFYGPHPPVEAVQNIQAAVLAIYAERDQRINQGIPAIEEAMRDFNKVYEKVIYPGTDHAFFNDTGTRYNPHAAEDAWRRTLDWFGEYL